MGLWNGRARGLGGGRGRHRHCAPKVYPTGQLNASHASFGEAPIRCGHHSGHSHNRGLSSDSPLLSDGHFDIKSYLWNAKINGARQPIRARSRSSQLAQELSLDQKPLLWLTNSSEQSRVNIMQASHWMTMNYVDMPFHSGTPHIQ